MYLIVNISCPEAGSGTIIVIRWKERWTFNPDVIDVLKDDNRFTNGLIVMKKHWDLLVNGIGFKEEIAFGGESLFDKVERNGLEVEGNLNPIREWAWPFPKKLHIISCTTCSHD